MRASAHRDPAECNALMRFQALWSGLGLPPKLMASLEVRGRTSGSRRSNPVVIATVEGKRYLVSMLGPGSDWVRNIEASHGDAVIRQGRRRRVHLVLVPPEQRAPILHEYVRVAFNDRPRQPLNWRSPSEKFAEAVAMIA